MFKFRLIVCVCISFCAWNGSCSTTQDHVEPNYFKMTCSDLLLRLIKQSSFHKTFSDQKLALEFYFERNDAEHIIFKFVQRAGDAKGQIYANFELDLVNNTLMIIDPDPPIPIKVQKNYIPFIAEKCTPDQNLYGNTGRLPDEEFDGGK